MAADLARPPRTAAIVNLGCKVNQSEMEAAARLLRARGVRLVDGGVAADLTIVNTCTVTAVAGEKSRTAVRRARRASPEGALVVTGCSVAVDDGRLRDVDRAARLVGNDGKQALLAELAALLPEANPDGAIRSPMPTLSGVALEGVADDRARVERTRAFVKVQDGCSFFCTYCIIPRARGPERSLSPDVVLADVRRALEAGHREIVLTGINIGTYDGGWSERGRRGSHTAAALTLAGLIRRILDETGVERLRLSSIEPQHVDAELLATWASSGGRCLPHFHLPLQSGDDGVLRRMGRRYTAGEYAQVVAGVRRSLVGVAVHADVIAGFPTEDDAAFARSVAFIRDLDLAGLHVFRYSARPGTAAIRMAGAVDDRTRKERAAILLELAAAARAGYARGRVGGRARVLVEEPLDDGRWIGRTEDYIETAVTPEAPHADRRIAENAIVEVRLHGLDPAAPGRAVAIPLAVSEPAALGGAR